MGEHTTISWTHHTFNPWWGCTEISVGEQGACEGCYAREWAKRFGVKWGTGEERRPASERTWAEPLKWNRRAGELGERRRVFCASMADVFDNEAPEGLRDRLWALIRETSHLDWLLLTKRIGNATRMLPADWGDGYANVWLGATIANQVEADRDIPKLLGTRACIRFISCEPLLGALDLQYPRSLYPDGPPMCCSGTMCGCMGKPVDPPLIWGINWVISGAESGRKARPSHPDWFRSLREQCAAAGVAFHHKQNGEWIEVDSGGPVREIDVGSQEADLTFQRDTDCLIAHDGRVFTSPDDLPLNVPARLMRRVGKLLAGRTLDGRIWNEFPRAAP